MKSLLGIILTVMVFIHIAPAQPGSSLFDDQIHDIYIDFPQPDYWQLLLINKFNDDSFNTSTFIPATVIIDGDTIDSTGIQFRGYSSYISYPTRKKPFQLSFDEYHPDQTYDGLTSLNLNNFFLDPTFCREKLCLDFLNQNNIPAPRGNYLRLYINGEYSGLYLMVERVNKTFCSLRFGNNDGNLFKGDNGTSKCATLEYFTDTTNYTECYELKTNEVQNDWSDFITFIDKINNTPDSEFHDSLEHYFNTKSFLLNWAACNLFTDYDSYPFLYQHSYYLYHNIATGKFEWIAWDMNGVLGPDLTEDYPHMDSTDILFFPEPTNKKPLCKRMLADSIYVSEYLNDVCLLSHFAFLPSVLDSTIDAWHFMIQPDVYADTLKMYTNAEFEMNFDSTVYGDKIIPGLKTFIASRSAFVNNQLDSLGYSDCLVFTGTEIITTVHPDLVISPNPFHDVSYLNLSKLVLSEGLLKDKDDLLTLRITDLSGRILTQQTTAAKDNIEIGNELPNGFYLLQVIGNQFAGTIRIVKE